MDLWVWLVVGVAVLALAVFLWTRLRRPRLRAELPGAAWQDRPRPGEIWWADVPFEDGPGSKVRPCVVLRTYRDRCEVLKITSQDQSHRRDHVEIPTRAWDKSADHNSFLDLTGPLKVRHRQFNRRAGMLDDRTWRRVLQDHQTGWMA